MGSGERAAPGLIAGRYRPVGVLGRGGMGVVYEARDERLDRRVAVKMLTGVESAVDEETRSRFLREAHALARIDHPDVVTLYDSGMHGPTPFLVMQVLDGMTLAALMAGARRLPTEAVCAVARGVTRALGAAHASGVFHRDVKPSNIGVRRDGRVVLQDFGLARLVGEAAVTRTGLMVGTPQFMAPEAMTGAAPTAAADFYGLGACMYLMVTGELPLGDLRDVGAILERALGRGVPGLVGQSLPYPQHLSQLIDRLCAGDPTGRLPGQAIEACLDRISPEGGSVLADLVREREKEEAVREAAGPPPARGGQAPGPAGSLGAYGARPAPTPVPRGVVTELPEQGQPEYDWPQSEYDRAPQPEYGGRPPEYGGDQSPASLPVPRSADEGPYRSAMLSAVTRRLVLSGMTPQGALSRQREAVNLVHRGEFREAAQMLATIVPICLSSLGPRHPTTLSSQYWHAVCLARLGAGPEAVELFSRVNRHVDQRKGTE
ncbi:serine/threonine-protein kinase [Streptomyces tsukubensis]|uniref:non-specific serine/threonine protein kinase n=1 Tax=Streptomyces tsukubensis TaxID=83656 RepID=A0A1V4AEQ8_9ACTN|nr:serine/threonine-protein kinase [Streptomyces tsukubensis]OON82126.1 hypothetical protein B1H18_03470 [Streptomyces tsukubensis]QFR92609.1 protein kinase [Streptomyces tsukubensis]